MVIRDSFVGAVHLGDGQALDIVAAPGEEPDDARQDTRLVVDEDGDGMALEIGHARASQTSTMPSSETGFSASSSGPSSISLWAAPEGIIGKQFSA